MCRVENWSTRLLAQKIDSMFYERTALSKKPEKLIRQDLAALGDKGDLTPALVHQDPRRGSLSTRSPTYDSPCPRVGLLDTEAASTNEGNAEAPPRRVGVARPRGERHNRPMTPDEFSRKLAAIDAKPIAEVSAAEVGLSLVRRLRSLDVPPEELPRQLRNLALVLDVDGFVITSRSGFCRLVELPPAVLLATQKAVTAIEGRFRVEVFRRVLSHLPEKWERRGAAAHKRSVKKLLTEQPIIAGYLRGHDKGWRFAHNRWPKPSPQVVKEIRSNAAAIDRALAVLKAGKRR